LKRGYAFDLEEDEVGGRCVAAPVRDASGSVVAAIGISGIVLQMPDNRLHELGAMLKSRAAEISTRLGHIARPAPKRASAGQNVAR
jgi:DNA-binding IclR family transcriptional regulator